MWNLTSQELGTAIIAIAVVGAAGLAGAMVHRSMVLESITSVPSGKGVAEPVHVFKPILEEQHLTSWQGMSGGATGDAKVVRTMTAAPPEKWGIIPQRPLQPPPVQATPWPLGK